MDGVEQWCRWPIGHAKSLPDVGNYMALV
jgi:hypothetical protein